MSDEMERIGPEVKRQFEHAEEHSEVHPAGQELPWVIPRSQLESMNEEELRFLLIDTYDKLGRLVGVVMRIGADDPEILEMLNPSGEPK